jgi:signal transduction histidine kinase
LYLDLAQAADNTSTAEMLTRAAKSISEIINEVRAISHNLVPPTLGDLGLVESVQELADTLRLVQNMKVVFIYHHFSETGLPENLRLMLYRIIQEGLNNIQKHAHARSVTLQLTSNSRILVLEITDDGQGFMPETARRGLGLSNIRNRVELFGGKLLIKAAPSAGCTLKVIIPLVPTAPVL